MSIRFKIFENVFKINFIPMVQSVLSLNSPLSSSSIRLNRSLLRRARRSLSISASVLVLLSILVWAHLEFIALMRTFGWDEIKNLFCSGCWSHKKIEANKKVPSTEEKMKNSLLTRKLPFVWFQEKQYIFYYFEIQINPCTRAPVTSNGCASAHTLLHLFKQRRL